MNTSRGKEEQMHKYDVKCEQAVKSNGKELKLLIQAMPLRKSR
jgi:hypothetical protein